MMDAQISRRFWLAIMQKIRNEINDQVPKPKEKQSFELTVN